MARGRRAPAFRARAGVRYLGSLTHRTQLGRPDVTKGRTRVGDHRPLSSGPPSDLLWHPPRQCRYRSGVELGVAHRSRSRWDLLHLQRNRGGALSHRPVPRRLSGIQTLEQNARTFHLLEGRAVVPNLNGCPHLLIEDFPIFLSNNQSASYPSRSLSAPFCTEACRIKSSPVPDSVKETIQ